MYPDDRGQAYARSAAPSLISRLAAGGQGSSSISTQSGTLSSTSDLNLSGASALSSTGDVKPRAQKYRKLGRIWKWIKYGRRKGILDVGPCHPNYTFIAAIRHCFQTKLVSDLPRHHLKQKDYAEVAVFHSILSRAEAEVPLASRRPSLRSRSRVGDSSVISLEPTRKAKLQKRLTHVEVSFKVFAPVVFASLRAALGIRHEDFLESISPPEEYFRYLQHVTNSKSKYCFFLTYDRRFVLKIETLKGIQGFLNHLEDYIDHFISSPHSLLVKIVGIYGIKIKRNSWVHFIVMQSIFWPSIRIGEKYDIKGCLLGRYEPNISADDDVVQKDGNFHGTPLNFGQYQSWLLEQINRDVEFLRSHGIVDYSLLVGIQRSLNLKSFHLQRLSVAEIVTSFKRSSIGFANDAAHEIRSASARKRKQTIQNGRTLSADSSHMVEESGSKTSPSKPASKVSAPLERRHSTSSFLSELINDTTKETDFVTANKLTATAATAPQQIILKPLKPKKVKHMKVRQVTFSRSVSESRYTPPASTSPTPSLHFQIHSQASPSPLSSPSHRTTEKSTKKSSEESGNTSFHSPGISPLVERINQQLSFSPDPKTDDGEDNPDLIEYAPRTVDGQTTEESIIYDWHKLDDFMAIENRRLLPDTPNAVHILDGPGNRYYLGIVDIFTPYGFRQRLGGLGKTLLLCGSNHSSAGPDKYAKRLLNFLEDHLC